MILIWTENKVMIKWNSKCTEIITNKSRATLLSLLKTRVLFVLSWKWFVTSSLSWTLRYFFECHLCFLKIICIINSWFRGGGSDVSAYALLSRKVGNYTNYSLRLERQKHQWGATLSELIMYLPSNSRLIETTNESAPIV